VLAAGEHHLGSRVEQLIQVLLGHRVELRPRPSQSPPRPDIPEMKSRQARACFSGCRPRPWAHYVPALTAQVTTGISVVNGPSQQLEDQVIITGRAWSGTGRALRRGHIPGQAARASPGRCAASSWARR
jgi:hypothetical protein